MTGYVSLFTGVFNWPLPPTTWPSGPIWRPVDQPYVGSPPTFGSAFTTRTASMSWLASSFASSWPTALRTGVAAFFAASTLTGSVPAPLASVPAPLAVPLAHTVVLLQLSVPGAKRLNVQVPGAFLFTRRPGPEPSLVAPTIQASPSAFGVPSTPRALASPPPRPR